MKSSKVYQKQSNVKGNQRQICRGQRKRETTNNLIFFFFILVNMVKQIFSKLTKYKTDRIHLIVWWVLSSPLHQFLSIYTHLTILHLLSLSIILFSYAFLLSLSECFSVCVCVQKRESEREEKKSLTLPTAASCHNCQVMMKHCCDRRQYSRYGREEEKLFLPHPLQYLPVLPPIPPSLHTFIC